MAKAKEVKGNYCLKHRIELPVSEFYQTENPNHGQYMPYCKRCTQEIFETYYKRFKNIETALWYTCAELGIPFLRKVYERTMDRVGSAKNPNYIGVYITMFNISKNKTDKWESFADTDVPMGEVDKVRDIEALRENQIKELKMTWGDDLDIDDITFLEWRFTTYTDGIELTEYQASRYRDLCTCELKIKKNIDIQQNMKAKATIAKELGIDQFTIDKEKSDVEKMLEYDIYIMEKYEPAEYYGDKDLYKDYMYIKRDWIDYVLRPIKNLIVGSKDYNISKDGDNLE